MKLAEAIRMLNEMCDANPGMTWEIHDFMEGSILLQLDRGNIHIGVALTMVLVERLTPMHLHEILSRLQFTISRREASQATTAVVPE